MSHSPQLLLDLVEGDTEPFIINFPGVDITGWAIELHLGYPTPLVKVAAIVVTGPDGRAEVTWSPTDLVSGRYPTEIQVTKPGGFVLTGELFIADIRKQVA